MGLLKNAARLVTDRDIAREYVNYLFSMFVGQSDAARRLFGEIEVIGFSGFSEYHSCASYVSEDEYEFLSQQEMSEGVIVDVGANLGVFSLLLAKQHPHREVHAFEPSPSTFQALKKNISHNGVDNVVANEKAVGDVDEWTSFQADPESRATARFSGESSAHAVEVSCVQLDTYLEQHDVDRVAFLKVDVEGFEMSVFRGARSLLKEHRASMVYFEVCPGMSQQAGYGPTDATAFLDTCGYSLFRIESGGTLVRADPSEAKAVSLENWVAVSPENTQ